MGQHKLIDLLSDQSERIRARPTEQLTEDSKFATPAIPALIDLVKSNDALRQQAGKAVSWLGGYSQMTAQLGIESRQNFDLHDDWYRRNPIPG